MALLWYACSHLRNLGLIMPISIEYFCNTCDEYKESEEIVFDDSDTAYFIGGQVISYCRECLEDIEIIEEYFE